MEFPQLPRFGLRLFLKKEYEGLKFYGLGPHESYVDKRRSCSHGLYESTVEEQHEDYLRPQENGSHTDCDYMVLEKEAQTFMAVSPKPFAFNVSYYTQEELTEKAHNFELENQATLLSVWIMGRMESAPTAAGRSFAKNISWIKKDLHLR